MPSVIKPTHKAVQNYYHHLEELAGQKADHEGAVSIAFLNLLTNAARKKNWTTIHQETMRLNGGHIRPEATCKDQWGLPHGYWEAKDTGDDLDKEIRAKIAKGYPTSNIIFEDTRTGVLYQDGDEVLRVDLSDARQLTDLLNAFLDYAPPAFEQFEQAVAEFQERIPDLAKGLDKRIKEAHKTNKPFKAAFEAFLEVCRNSLNPNIARDAVDEMLIQHLLTERLIRRIFDNPDFVSRNVIAAEIEKVIAALTSQVFNRTEFLGALDRFYEAIELAADNLADFSEKQHFLNTVYERFFQGYSVKVADTHGIVYTPQEIVDFMLAAVEEVLHDEFGLHWWDEGINVLDPATGTGNFIVNLLRRIPVQHIQQVYRQQLFANEVMLMPYYIASLNIEHEYYESTGTYEPFEGISFVDTLDLAVGQHQPTLPYFAEKNAERVYRQKNAPVTVIIGNPPYNVGQINENDNNKNRRYEHTDKRLQQTYVQSSKASNRNALYDPYVKFFRWATDRLRTSGGIVCFVSNNSFIDQLAFDGMRKHLRQDFSTIYHIDLHGNVRQNPQLSGTTHNVFGIQVGVGITVAVRQPDQRKKRIFYHRVPEFWHRVEKLDWLRGHSEQESVLSRSIEWEHIKPDFHHTWLIPEHAGIFETFIPLGTQEVKSDERLSEGAIFVNYSNGVKTNRDIHVYDFDPDTLSKRVQSFIEAYNAEVDRYRRLEQPNNVDDFVSYEAVKWSEGLKSNLSRGRYGEFRDTNIRRALYRPFTTKAVYFDDLLNERRYLFPQIFPTEAIELENRVIWIKVGSEWPMFPLMSNGIVDLLPQGGSQCFPFYIYDEDGRNRRENITDWAVQQFRERYEDKKILKFNIFYYVYGLLHHPAYREKYADSLKRELPRIPFAPDFWAFSKAGKKLADLHLNYEEAKRTELEWEIDEDSKPSELYHIEKMRLQGGKREGKGKDRVVVKWPDRLKVNDTLTLRGIPAEVYQYRLGNRSALEWIVDQYQIKTDKRSGITHDPNNPDDPEYIVHLVERIITVSLETVKLVDSLPEDFGG